MSGTRPHSLRYISPRPDQRSEQPVFVIQQNGIQAVTAKRSHRLSLAGETQAFPEVLDAVSRAGARMVRRARVLYVLQAWYLGVARS